MEWYSLFVQVLETRNSLIACVCDKINIHQTFASIGGHLPKTIDGLSILVSQGIVKNYESSELIPVFQFLPLLVYQVGFTGV